MCFDTYPEVIRDYSVKYGKTSTLKEIHIVDIDKNVVTMMQTDFLRAITGSDSNKDYKSMKIPERTKETPRELTWILPNKVQLVICDGPLFTTFSHSHIPKAMSSYYDLQETAVVITEDTSLKGSSRSASLCYQKCGDDFRRYYDQLKDVKKKCGKVYMKYGDDSLKFGHVIFAIMPSLGKQSLSSSEHKRVLGFICQCCRNLLTKSESSSIKHLCLPVFIEGIIILFLLEFINNS